MLGHHPLAGAPLSSLEEQPEAQPFVSPDDAAHGHTAGQPTLTQAHVLSPDDALHGQSADEPSVGESFQLAPEDALHGHTAGEPGFAIHITPAFIASTALVFTPSISTQIEEPTPVDRRAPMLVIEGIELEYEVVRESRPAHQNAGA